MLTWYTLESGGVWKYQNHKAEFLDKARRFFEKYAKTFPENRIARMYLGEPILNSRPLPLCALERCGRSGLTSCSFYQRS